MTSIESIIEIIDEERAKFTRSTTDFNFPCATSSESENKLDNF